MEGYLAGVLGVLAIAGAAASYGFWRSFGLAFAGSAMLLFGAQFAREFAEGSRTVEALSVFLGIGLAVAAFFLRRSSVSAPLCFAGVALLFAAAILRHENLSGLAQHALLVTAVPLLIFAAARARSRLAPIAAIVGLFAVAAFSPAIDLFYQTTVSLAAVLRDYEHVVIATETLANLGYGAWGVLFLLFALFGPRHLISRVVLYALMVFGILMFPWEVGGEIERALGASDSQLMWWAPPEKIVAAIAIAAMLVLARNRLFDIAAVSAAGAPDIFLSYKREERPRVEAIAGALRDLKFNVWFDARLVSGRAFDDEINLQIRTARAVLVCWSAAAVGSEWVRAEATIGRQRGVLRACMLENCELTPPFNLVHAEDLTSGALDGSNVGWVRLVDQLGELTGRPGLGAYVSGGPSQAKAWAAAHSGDPLGYG